MTFRDKEKTTSSVITKTNFLNQEMKKIMHCSAGVEKEHNSFPRFHVYTYRFREVIPVFKGKSKLKKEYIGILSVLFIV